jgi:peptidoglycan/LPS O-acetylase OafA/YrhL
VAWGATILLLVLGTNFPAFGHQIYAVLFLVIIMNVATRPDSAITRVLEHKWLNYLGKISYGLYMYHFLVIGTAIALLRTNVLGKHTDLISNVSLYAVTFFLTIAVSAFSYHFFESRCMQLRSQLRKLLSKKPTPLVAAQA